ncbi:MAG: serine/threonine-protein kinase [Sandaracinaceae bacterium]
MELAEGAVLADRYRLGSRIGSGGMGEVYAATQLQLNRPVAIKVLQPNIASDPVAIERFRREAQVTAGLHHPHIVAVTDVHLGAGGRDVSFFVMEKLSGRLLQEALREGPMDVQRAVKIALSVLSALDAAHAAGIVHRDLKPANVFLVPLANGDELTKLLDFGVAHLRSGGGPRLTEEGELIGTLRYAAPEQLLGHPPDARTDVFAAGGLLYLMLAGRPAFDGTQTELLTQVCEADPMPLRALRPEVPPRIVGVIAQAMAKRPADRFESAAAMASALRKASEDIARLSAPPSGSSAVVQDPTPPTPRAREVEPSTVTGQPSRKVLWGAGAAAVAAAIAGFGLVLYGLLGNAGSDRASVHESPKVPPAVHPRVVPDRGPEEEGGADGEGTSDVVPPAILATDPPSELTVPEELAPGSYAIDPSTLAAGMRVLAGYPDRPSEAHPMYLWAAEVESVEGSLVAIRWCSDRSEQTVPLDDLFLVFSRAIDRPLLRGERVSYLGQSAEYPTERVVGTVQRLRADGQVVLTRIDGMGETVPRDRVLGPARVEPAAVRVDQTVEVIDGPALRIGRVTSVDGDTVHVAWRVVATAEGDPFPGGYRREPPDAPERDVEVSSIVSVLAHPLP